MIQMQGHLKIRSYHNADYDECRELFSQGMQQFICDITSFIMSTFLWYIAMVTIFAVMATLKWFFWILFTSLLLCLILWCLLYVLVNHICRKFINHSLKTDLMDIDKTYMTNKGCHMWVAEWNDKVVGMVGLVQNENHKTGTSELQRMYVFRTCQKWGVGSKLLEELLKYSREEGLEKIVLTTTSTQGPAIRLYRKFGFKLIERIPITPTFIIKDLASMSFELEL